MYSNKENVNILTALLLEYGIRHAVVCPGSRNAPIVHNLNECPGITCHPITDERSAGFYAIGMTQALHEPVVVCVTSGTALLNLAPAVAEAWYQHLPLIVVSADRPQEWIDQLDGQTLPQPGALGRFVKRAVSLPEKNRWHINRLVNEALIEATSDDARPVHINVPISEPLFGFETPELPKERSVIRQAPPTDYDCLHEEFVEGLLSAQRPMIVFGQTRPTDFGGNDLSQLFSRVIVLHEALSAFPNVSHFDEVLYAGGIEAPDFIIYVGDTIVSKRLRHFLRRATRAVTWRISPTGMIEDTFQNLRGVIVGDAEFVLQSLDRILTHREFHSTTYRQQWLSLLTKANVHAQHYEPAFSQMAAVKCFEQTWSEHYGKSTTSHVHYANSSAIRLANIYAAHHVWCNRGVNGIEGSLSTAAGYSLVTTPLTFCVIGDLSFFYDQNALWNQQLRGNLRILLLNNGRGGIFNLLPGLEQSPARDAFVSASHHTTAEGICQQNNIYYQQATNLEETIAGIRLLFTETFSRPMLLEVLTDAADDEHVFRDYFQTI